MRQASRFLPLLRGLLLSALLLPNFTQAGEPPTEPILRIEAGMHTSTLRRISTDAAGRYAVTASDDKTARVWDVASGKLLQVLRPPIDAGNVGKLYAVALSPDASTVAVGGWSTPDAIFLFDRASGKLLRRLSGLPNVIFHLSFSPDGRWLAASLGGSNGVRVWDWRKGSEPLADTPYGDRSNGLCWSADSRLATTSYDGKVRLYQLENLRLDKLVEVTAPGGKQPYGVAFAPNGRSLAVGYTDAKRVDVLDAADLNLRFSPDVSGGDKDNLDSVSWSADGQTLYAGGPWHKDNKFIVRRWPDAGRGQPVDTMVADNTIMDLQPLPQGGVLVGAAGPAWGLLNSQNQWQALGQPPIAELNGSRGASAFTLSASGKQVQFGFEWAGKQPHRFDMALRSLAAGTLPSGEAPQVKTLSVTDWINNTIPKLNNQALPLRQYERARSLAITPTADHFVLGAEWSLRLFDTQGKQQWEKPAPGVVWGVNIPSSGKIVVAAYGDGTIRWHRLSDGQELLAFFPHADRKRWVLWTPSGYYDASPGGEELIGWHVNRGQDQAADFFPASRFRERFNRPDVIDRILDTLDEGEALKQANSAAGRKVAAPVSVAQVLPPVVDLMSSAELTAGSTQVTFRYRVRTAADAPLTGVRVRVNGQAVPDTRALQRIASPDAEREIKVTIPAQDSQIELFAENRHGVSTPALIKVKWNGAKPAADSFVIKPKLYVLAVGVAKYQHGEIGKLEFSAKDARDFAAMLKQQSKLYRDVEIKLLTDADATRDNVVDGLEWLQKQVTQHDMGMVFMAGHGVNDPAGGYYYLPVNADPDKLKRTGVSMADIRSTLANLPGKAVFFIDTCHAGSVLGAGRRGVANDIGGMINELSSAENGVVVFSSSTGRQFSLEDAAWGNGAFTKAVIEGMNGGADYQKTGRITHKMLDLFVSERVKQLTSGKQSPVTQAPGGVPDFPLAMAR